MNVILPEIALVLHSFDIGIPLGIRRPLFGLNNENYIVQTDRGIFFLKKKLPQVYEDELDLEREVRNASVLIRIKKEANIQELCVPILNEHGRYLTAVNGGYYFLYPYVEGTHASELTCEQASSLGSVLERFHSISENFIYTSNNTTDM